MEQPGFTQPEGDLPDGLLAARAAEGDDAFAVLVRRHSRPLLGLAYYMLGSPQDAEEAVQDAFVSAWRRLPEYRQAAEFRTWMYRITVNRCLNMRHRRSPPLPRTPSPNPRRATRLVHPPEPQRRTQKWPP